MKHPLIPLLVSAILQFGNAAIVSAAVVEVVVYTGPTASARGDVIVQTIPDYPGLHPVSSKIKDIGTPRSRLVARIEVPQYHSLSNFLAYTDVDGNGEYTPGEPAGVSNGYDDRTIYLSRMTSVMPRIDLWDGSCDRKSYAGVDQSLESMRKYANAFSNVTNLCLATGEKVRLNVVLYALNHRPFSDTTSGQKCVLSHDYYKDTGRILHDGSVLGKNSLDIGWGFLSQLNDERGVYRPVGGITNVIYGIELNGNPVTNNFDLTMNPPTHPIVIERRYESVRSVPEGIYEVKATRGYEFAFRIPNEDFLSSFFGTTYTAYRLKVLKGNELVYDSNVKRMPVPDAAGLIRVKAPTLQPGNYTWRCAVYNAKFYTDDLMFVDYGGPHTGDAFSTPRPFTVYGD